MQRYHGRVPSATIDGEGRSNNKLDGVIESEVPAGRMRRRSIYNAIFTYDSDKNRRSMQSNRPPDSENAAIISSEKDSTTNDPIWKRINRVQIARVFSCIALSFVALAIRRLILAWMGVISRDKYYVL